MILKQNSSIQGILEYVHTPGRQIINIENGVSEKASNRVSNNNQTEPKIGHVGTNTDAECMNTRGTQTNIMEQETPTIIAKIAQMEEHIKNFELGKMTNIEERMCNLEDYVYKRDADVIEEDITIEKNVKKERLENELLVGGILEDPFNWKFNGITSGEFQRISPENNIQNWELDNICQYTCFAHYLKVCMASDCADIHLLQKLIEPMTFEEFTSILEPLPILNWEMHKGLFTNLYTEFLKLRIVNDNYFAALMGKMGQMDITILFLNKNKELGIGYTVKNENIYIHKLEKVEPNAPENLIGKTIRDVSLQYTDSYKKAIPMIQKAADKSYKNYMKIWSLAHLPSMEEKAKQMEYNKAHYCIGTPTNSGNVQKVRESRFNFFDTRKTNPQFDLKLAPWKIYRNTQTKLSRKDGIKGKILSEN